MFGFLPVIARAFSGRSLKRSRYHHAICEHKPRRSKRKRPTQVYRDPEVVSHYASLNYLTPCERLLFDTYIKPGRRFSTSGSVEGARPRISRSKASRYVGVDYSEEMIKTCRNKFPQLEFEVADASDLSGIFRRFVRCDRHLLQWYGLPGSGRAAVAMPAGMRASSSKAEECSYFRLTIRVLFCCVPAGTATVCVLLPANGFRGRACSSAACWAYYGGEGGAFIFACAGGVGGADRGAFPKARFLAGRRLRIRSRARRT